MKSVKDASRLHTATIWRSVSLAVTVARQAIALTQDDVEIARSESTYMCKRRERGVRGFMETHHERICKQAGRSGRPGGVMTARSLPDGSHTLYVGDSLRTPLDTALRHTVRALLRSGWRHIVLDLARVSAVDAAGIGELVRAYNMTAAVNGAVRIVHATTRVRVMLERVGLLALLETAEPAESNAASTATRADLRSPQLRTTRMTTYPQVCSSM
jgi:anti-anti-sigma factor